MTKAPNNQIDEHTVFSNSPEGFVLTSNDATDREGDETTHIQYEITYQVSDAFRLPDLVHLKVNDNIDTRFTFTNCSVQKGINLKVLPSP